MNGNEPTDRGLGERGEEEKMFRLFIFRLLVHGETIALKRCHASILFSYYLHVWRQVSFYGLFTMTLRHYRVSVLYDIIVLKSGFA